MENEKEIETPHAYLIERMKREREQMDKIRAFEKACEENEGGWRMLL